MEPKNFSSPDAAEKSRGARLNKLRERRTKAVTSINESIPLRPLVPESKPRIVRTEMMRAVESMR